MPLFRRVKKPGEFSSKLAKTAAHHLQRPKLLKMLMQARHRSADMHPRIAKRDFFTGILYKNGHLWMALSHEKSKDPFSSTEVWLRDRVLWKAKNKRPTGSERSVSSQLKAKYIETKKRPKKEIAFRVRQLDALLMEY